MITLLPFVSGAIPIALAQDATTGDPSEITGSNAPSMGGTPNGPLTVDRRSHVVVMEYEAWFGPNAVTFQNAEAMPLLQSDDMQSVGGGYDSTDPKVIQKHVHWMQYMGVDAALIEVTNNVGCIFSTGPVSSKFCSPATESFRESNQTILHNTANLYPAWSKMKTPLKLIPMFGTNSMDLIPENNGLTGLQNEALYFSKYMEKYPQLNVIYLGHPLMLIFIGVSTLPSEVMAQLHALGLDSKYTFRVVGGYFDSQPQYWANQTELPKGPIEIAPQYDFWSWVDRYKSSNNLYPTYNVLPVSSNNPRPSRRAENFTVSIATMGESGWGCPAPKYCPDDALRFQNGGWDYATFNSFMPLAKDLDPIFLILHQFNEFSQPDEGWNANTSDDIEPTLTPQGWGYSGIHTMHDQIKLYRYLTQTFQLSVSTAGDGFGMIFGSNNTINCGVNSGADICTAKFRNGTSVTLTAAAANDSVFSGWSGACSGSGSCTLTMNANKNVMADFSLKTYKINVSAGIGGKISPSGNVSVNYGANQSSTVTPDPNYLVSSIIVDGRALMITNIFHDTYTFRDVIANHTIHANFIRKFKRPLGPGGIGLGG